ncbi:MAG: metallophosphoesterase [Micrococcaceae bacterium]
MTLYLTADTHFGHAPVTHLRGFDTTDKHDDFIIKSYKEIITEDDEVYFLGDMVTHEKASDYMLEIVKDLPGKKYLISGNHDPVHPMFKDWKVVVLL